MSVPLFLKTIRIYFNPKKTNNPFFKNLFGKYLFSTNLFNDRYLTRLNFIHRTKPRGKAYFKVRCNGQWKLITIKYSRDFTEILDTYVWPRNIVPTPISSSNWRKGFKYGCDLLTLTPLISLLFLRGIKVF